MHFQPLFGSHFAVRVIVFIASSIMHMVLPYHKSDYRQNYPMKTSFSPPCVPPVCRRALYFSVLHAQGNEFACRTGKIQAGAGGHAYRVPSGPPAMPKFLAMWFAYTLIISVVVANLAAHSVMPGAPIGASSRGGDGGVPCLRCGNPEQRHLKGQPWKQCYQRGRRWTRLRAADRRHLWLALAH